MTIEIDYFCETCKKPLPINSCVDCLIAYGTCTVRSGKLKMIDLTRYGLESADIEDAAPYFVGVDLAKGPDLTVIEPLKPDPIQAELLEWLDTLNKKMQEHFMLPSPKPFNPLEHIDMDKVIAMARESGMIDGNGRHVPAHELFIDPEAKPCNCGTECRNHV